MKASDLLKENRPPSILIYGAAGTSKTALASQASGGYLFDFDRGMRTAAKLQDSFFDARNAIEFDEFRDENPRKPVEYMKARKQLQVIVDSCQAGKWDRDAVVIDSLTGLCRAAQLHVQSLGDKSNPMRDPLAKMEIQNWGSLVTEVERFLTLVRSLRVLTIVTAHVEVVEDSGGGIEMFPMSATKSHGLNKLMWLFDECWYADKRPAGAGIIQYRISGNTTGSVKSRTRSGIETIVHNEIGLAGLLKETGYIYGGKNEEVQKA